MANRVVASLVALVLLTLAPIGPVRGQPAAPTPPPGPAPPPAPPAPPAYPPATPPNPPANPPGPAQPAPSPALTGPIPTIPNVPTTPARPLNLADAVGLALQNAFQTRQAALNVAFARAQLNQANAGLLPTVNGQVNFTYNSLSNQVVPLTGTISIPSLGISNQTFFTSPLLTTGLPQTSTQFALVIHYPFYTGGALEDQVRIAQANLSLAQAQFAAAAEQVVLNVRTAYYQAQAAQAAVGAAQRAVDAAQENVRVTQAQVQVGTSPQFNLLQAQVQLASSQQTLSTAITVAAQAQQNLAAVLVLPLGTTFGQIIPSELPEVPADVDAMIGQALVNRPEIAEALASEQAAQAAIDLAATGLAPNITFTGGPEVTTNDPTRNDQVNWTALIALTIALFDGGLTRAKVDAARQQLNSAKVAEQQTRQSVELDVRNAYLGLRNAAENLRSALVGQASAHEALRISNVRFQAGVGTQLEVVTQIQNSATADLQVIQAALNYFVAVAQLDRSIGVQVKL
jgi:outer membrane protein TolC